MEMLKASSLVWELGDGGMVRLNGLDILVLEWEVLDLPVLLGWVDCSGGTPPPQLADHYF